MSAKSKKPNVSKKSRGAIPLEKPRKTGEPRKTRESREPHQSRKQSEPRKAAESRQSRKPSGQSHKPRESQPPSFGLSKKSQEIIKREMSRYETPRSGLIPALWQIQKEKGWVSKEAVLWLSQETGIPTAAVYEVLMFYTMFNKKPVGRFHIQVCCNVSCALSGARGLAQKLCQELNVREGEQSACGNWTVSRVECLGACDEAPVLRLNEEYIGKVKPDKILPFLKSKAESP